MARRDPRESRPSRRRSSEACRLGRPRGRCGGAARPDPWGGFARDRGDRIDPGIRGVQGGNELEALAAVPPEARRSANPDLLERFETVGDERRAQHGDPLDSATPQIVDRLGRIRLDPRRSPEARLEADEAARLVDVEPLGEEARRRERLGPIAVAIDLADRVAAIRADEAVSAARILLPDLPLGKTVEAEENPFGPEGAEDGDGLAHARLDVGR